MNRLLLFAYCSKISPILRYAEIDTVQYGIQKLWKGGGQESKPPRTMAIFLMTIFYRPGNMPPPPRPLPSIASEGRGKKEFAIYCGSGKGARGLCPFSPKMAPKWIFPVYCPPPSKIARSARFWPQLIPPLYIVGREGSADDGRRRVLRLVWGHQLSHVFLGARHVLDGRLIQRLVQRGVLPPGPRRRLHGRRGQEGVRHLLQQWRYIKVYPYF